MYADEIFGLIEKKIAIKENNEPNDQTSSLDILPVKKDSATLRKETQPSTLVTRESLETGIPQQFIEEVSAYDVFVFIFV